LLPQFLVRLMSDTVVPTLLEEPPRAAASPRPARLPLGHSLAFASLGIPTAIVALMMYTFMPRFYADHAGLALSSVAAVFLIVRLIDIPFDLLVGLLIDRTRLKFGRYKSWMLVAIPFVMASCWGLFMPPARAGVGYLVFWLAVSNAGLSIFILSYASWTSSLAPHYAERSRLFGLVQGLGTLGSIGILLLPVLTHGRVTAGASSSMETIGWICIALLPVSALLAAVFTPDRSVTQTAPRSMHLREIPSVIARPTVLRLIAGDICLFLALSLTAPIQIFFLKDAKGFSIPEISLLMIFFVAAGALGSPTWGRLGARIGKHRAIQFAGLFYALCHLTLVFLPAVAAGHGPLQMAPTAMALFAVGFCGSAFGILIRAMVGDAADEVLLEIGVDRTGLLYSMVSTTTKIGGALGVITFPLLAAFGYSASAKVVNTPAAIFDLKLIYCVLPLIFLLLGAIAFWGYTLDARRHAQIRQALESSGKGPPRNAVS
jgi:glycoside/pentoside/hexuronide:cation symporter, GPH family